MEKKRNLILLLIFVSLALSFVVVSCTNIGGDCENELLNEVQSPNGKLKVIIFQRDCGATTGFSTQVSILPNGDKLPNEGGNIFVADTDHGKAPSGEGGGPKVEVRWINENELLIRHDSRARVFHSEQSLNNVKIRYEQASL
ncbi:MAG TPA: hypothetical protein VE732_04690 [Nitrososphaera sp.]|jgi:hypothetical protein|nr:hypothetical protein [Nitrososphaera sp.]